MSDGVTEQQPSVLVVDDEHGIRELLKLLLETEGYHVLTARSGDQALEIYAENKVDLVIQDLKMPGLGGLELLRSLKEQSAHLPVLVITAFSNWDDAVEAMRLGAFNYIRKPFDTDNIRRIVRRALEATSLDANVGVADVYRQMIGNHPSMNEIASMVQRIAVTDSTVLIQGESGTGKEVVARAIHCRSQRRAQPFVPVNCSAFTEGLLESELFGHLRGAFTGAVEDKDGLFQAAEGGTIFLDEVGEMNLATQVKLLRVLEERKVSPVGSTQLVPIDVRVVAATNRVLEEEVQQGNFRKDLFFRLNVIPVTVPPLRQRAEDIPLLLGHFLAKYSNLMRKSVTSISDRALRSLCEHSWPGNVRELENIVQRHVALCEGTRIEDISIAGGFDDASTNANGGLLPGVGEDLIPAGGIDLERTLEDIERRYILEALRLTGGHITNASKLLGMSYRSIRYRIKKLGIREQVTQ